MQFTTLRDLKAIKMRVIRFFTQNDTELVTSFESRLLFRREPKPSPWYTFQPAKTGYNIEVSIQPKASKYFVTCRYSVIHQLNICDQKSGPFLEVSRLAQYCS